MGKPQRKCHAPRQAVLNTATLKRATASFNVARLGLAHFPRGRILPSAAELKAVAKVSGAENFVGSLCRNLRRIGRIGHFSTKASTKFATKMQHQRFCNR